MTEVSLRSTTQNRRQIAPLLGNGAKQERPVLSTYKYTHLVPKIVVLVLEKGMMSLHSPQLDLEPL